MVYDPDIYWKSLHDAKRGTLSAVGWPSLGEGFNREAYKLRLRAAEEVLRRLRIPVHSVLEGGVGVGAYAPLWQTLGVACWTGIDLSAVAIADLSERFPEHRFLTANLSEEDAPTDLQRETFSLVTAVDVLFHIVDESAFVRAVDNLARFVEPGGALMISGVFPAESRQQVSHVKQRPLSSFELVLEPHGLSLADREPVFAILDEPMRRPGVVQDWALSACWKAVSASLRLLPKRTRSIVGAQVVRTLAPLDATLRASGAAAGVNLELAVFRRNPEPTRPTEREPSRTHT